jgi:sugar O-acyltransferase (sialic acid O-acetyltransferase NeuD family)
MRSANTLAKDTATATPRLLMVGGGGHARVLQEVLLEAGHELAGYVAPSDAGLALVAPVEGGALERFTDEQVLALNPESVLLINGLGSSGDLTLRASVFEKFKAAGFNFLQTTAVTSHVSESATLVEGVQVMHMAVVHSDAKVDDNTIVNTGAIVEHHNVIGAHCHIAIGAVLAGNVTIGDRTHIGANATVLQGVTIGSNCIIGAGAVVLNDVPDGHIAVGVPAVAKKRG